MVHGGAARARGDRPAAAPRKRPGPQARSPRSARCAARSRAAPVGFRPMRVGWPRRSRSPMQVLVPQARRGRVGFAIPRWTTDPVEIRQGIPFRCLSVAGALLAAGYEVVWFDQELDLDRADRSAAFLRELDGARALFIWMNELHPIVQTRNARLLAELVSARHPQLPIAVGGEFVSICPPHVLTVAPPVRCFLRGYGEESSVEWLEHLDGRRPAEEVGGMVWLDGERRANAPRGSARMNPEHQQPYRALDLSEYAQEGGIFGNGEPTFTLGTGRGCAKGCAFCYWYHHEPGLLRPAQIIELTSELRKRYGVKQYHYAELDAFAARGRPLELARLWRERFDDGGWFTLASVEDALRYDDAEWSELRRGGLAKLELGVESGSRAVLERMGKPHTAEQVLALVRRLHAHDIVPMLNFIFGTPEETDADRLETLRLIAAVHALAPRRITLTFRLFQPSWGTPLGERAIAATPDFPQSLEALAQYRPMLGAVDARAMPWLSADVERRIKRLVDHYLPLSISQVRPAARGRRMFFGALRHMARWRVHSGTTAFAADQWLYARCLAQPLHSTLTV
ncbi:MAG: B12-binding domain-containing radical SAM protein [Planctomycetota bacterium]|nr:MAG: B12-binding domain-containing radical SAM protein [Planctomycetota bacterium]